MRIYNRPTRTFSQYIPTLIVLYLLNTHAAMPPQRTHDATA